MKKIVFGFFTATLLLFSSCKNMNLLNPPEDDEKNTTLKISVSDSCRTVLPQTVGLEELTDFDLVGNIKDANQYSYGGGSAKKYDYYDSDDGRIKFGRNYSSITDLQNEEITLVSGEWSFTLTAKKGGTTYKAEKTQTIEKGENTISFELCLYDSGNGTGAFSITLDFSEAANASKVTSVKAIVQNIDKTDVEGISAQTLTICDNKVCYTESLKVGSYRALITLYSGDLELLTWREIVVISSDLISSAEQTIESLDSIYSINYVLNDDDDRKATFSSAVQENYTRRTDSFSIPTITRFSYQFLGWYENEDFSGDPIIVIDTSRLENITLYAKWKSLFSDSTLQSLSFSGKDVSIYDNEIQRNQITADVNTHEYYLEYKTLTVNTELTNPRASLSLSNNNAEMKIEAIDSTKQDIVLTVTSEDNTSSMTYLIHAVKIFNYEEACNLIATRIQNVRVKIIDKNENINTVGSSILSTPTPSAIGNAINKKDFDVSLDLSSTSVTSIGNYAFYGSKGLISIELPETLTSIGDTAFSGCSNLLLFAFPKSVNSIGIGAFSNCTMINEMELPNISCINDGLFSGCSNLEKVIVPYSVKYIGENAFSNCSNLKELIFEDTTSTWYGSVVVNFGVKHSVGTMNSPETNLNKFRDYKYYKIF